MRASLRLPCVLLLTIPLLLPVVVPAEEFLPLEIGSHWEYEGMGGPRENQDVVGTNPIWGKETYVIRFSESTNNNGLENYWTTQPDGDVELWGFYRALEDWGYLYDPPVVILDAPVILGKTWEVSFDVYALPGTTYVGSHGFTLEVLEEGLISVPAGDFYAYGIGEANIPDSGFPSEDVTLSGALTGDRVPGLVEWWYSDGVGQVQYRGDVIYQLTQFDLPTPIRAMTWGQIKLDYGN